MERKVLTGVVVLVGVLLALLVRYGLILVLLLVRHFDFCSEVTLEFSRIGTRQEVWCCKWSVAVVGWGWFYMAGVKGAVVCSRAPPTRAVCFMMSFPDDSAIGRHQKGPAETGAAV